MSVPKPEVLVQSEDQNAKCAMLWSAASSPSHEVLIVKQYNLLKKILCGRCCCHFFWDQFGMQVICVTLGDGPSQ